MHYIQQKILNLADEINLNRDGLRQVARLIGEVHPFKISYHINKLEENGFIEINKITGEIKRIKSGKIKKSKFIAIPVIGMAKCGDGAIFAEENFEGFIKVSDSFIKTGDGLIAVKVLGNSMNRASINKQNIEEGDFAIIDTKNYPKNGDYVLAIIDGCAVIKRLAFDKRNNAIFLISESTENHPAIFIHENDKFILNGIVRHIFKKPIINWGCK